MEMGVGSDCIQDVRAAMQSWHGDEGLSGVLCSGAIDAR